MKCSKCGAECNDNLAFCLECGNPLQLMADFNLIEKELANSIGAFMDEIENEDSPTFEDESDMKTIDVPLDDINMELRVMDINRGTSSSKTVLEDDFLLEDEEEVTPVYVPKKRKSNKKKKKNNKKKFVIIGIVTAILAVIALIVVLLLSGGEDKEKKPVVKDYAYYYSLAEKDLNKSDLDTALDNALLALENAGSNENIVAARLLIKSIYEKQKYTGDYYMENLAELFKLGENSQENAELLLGYYNEKNDVQGLLNVYDIVTEDVARETLGEAFIEKPEVNLPSGEYNNVIKIEISADKDSTIYYAIYKAGEEYEYTEYRKPVEVAELGEFTLSAYYINKDEKVSYKATYTYKIVEGEITGPVVTPEEGTYKEPTKITVQVPEGGKAYYTLDGTDPTTSSEEYVEPIDMLKGVSTFKVIGIDKYGNESEVVTLQYNLKLARNENVSTAKDKVWNYYFNNGLIDELGNMADGSVLEVAYHNAYDINNGEYYVYQVITKSADGLTTISISYCGVNTYDGIVYAGLVENGETFIIPETDSESE